MHDKNVLNFRLGVNRFYVDYTINFESNRYEK